MNAILMIDVTCNFLKLDRCKMLNGYVNFTFKILSLKITMVQSKRWKVEDGLNNILNINILHAFDKKCAM